MYRSTYHVKIYCFIFNLKITCKYLRNSIFILYIIITYFVFKKIIY